MRPLSFVRTLSRNNARRVDLPRFLTYTVSFACNARCIMCDSWKKEPEDELSLEELDRIFSELPRMDAVRITGGEPFVRKDLLHVACLVQEKLRPYFLHVTTNGFLTKRIVDFCERRPKNIPLQLLVSVDGVGEKHDHVRGNKIAWRSVMNTLEALAPRTKELRLSLSVNQTIVDAEGAEHYPRLRDIMAPMGVRTNVVMAYDSSATYSTEREVEVAPTEIGSFTTFGDFSTEQLTALLDAVEKDLASFKPAERMAKRYYLRGIRNRLLAERGSPNPKCVALNSHLRLFPNGDVPTCQFNSTRVGNLREQSFEELWFQSAKTDEQRAWVHACPGCWAECEVLPSAIYTGDIAKELVRRAPSTEAPAGPPGGPSGGVRVDLEVPTASERDDLPTEPPRAASA